VHTTHICTTPILRVGAKTCFPFRSIQKYSALEVDTNNIFDMFSPPIKCSMFLLLSPKSFVAKRGHGSMQKLFKKKIKEELKKDGQVFEISKKNGY